MTHPPDASGPVHPNRLLAILLQRCPVCLEGKPFDGLLHMHRTCPRCGIQFERETGFFLNAMFFAYALGFVVLAPSALYLYLTGASTALFTGVMAAEILLLWPLVFRYSRILWMHVDQMLDPRRIPSSAPEPDA